MTEEGLQMKLIRSTNGIEPLNDLIVVSRNPSFHFLSRPKPSIGAASGASSGRILLHVPEAARTS